MEHDTPSMGYRVELLDLRRRVTEARSSYRTSAIVLAVLALLVWPSVGEAPEPLPSRLLVAAIALLSLTSALGYRNVSKQPRFWTLLPAMAWNAVFVIGWGYTLFTNLSELWRGEVTFGELIGTLSFGGLLGVLFGLVVGLGWLLILNDRIVSREEADLIEGHREEWEAYLAGRRRRRASPARGSRKVPKGDSVADAGA